MGKTVRAGVMTNIVPPQKCYPAVIPLSVFILLGENATHKRYKQNTSTLIYILRYFAKFLNTCKLKITLKLHYPLISSNPK